MTSRSTDDPVANPLVLQTGYGSERNEPRSDPSSGTAAAARAMPRLRYYSPKVAKIDRLRLRCEATRLSVVVVA